VSEGLEEPRLGLEPDEDRREDAWEVEPESEAAAAAAEPEEEPPAEEDELPRSREPEHAAGVLRIPEGYGVIEGEPAGGRWGSSSDASTAGSRGSC
jgi:hypothetical protein